MTVAAAPVSKPVDVTTKTELLARNRPPATKNRETAAPVTAIIQPSPDLLAYTAREYQTPGECNVSSLATCRSSKNAAASSPRLRNVQIKTCPRQALETSKGGRCFPTGLADLHKAMAYSKTFSIV